MIRYFVPPEAFLYDDEQRVTEEKTTVTYTAAENPCVGYKKYYYNAQGSVIRTESWINGEETTNGKTIEETEYDENGNVVKSYSYNSLDSSSKFYKESEYSENGQVLADLDETGEYKTKYEYVPGSNVVRTEILPNGSKLSYGHDLSDTVTSVTQSTEEGEENSNQMLYTCGEVTQVRSGNNIVEYEYGDKRRLTRVDLNGQENYQSIEYFDNTTDDDVTGTIDKVVTTNAKSETFTSITDKRGNVRKVLYGTAVQVSSNYTGDNKISSITDAVSGTFNYTYNQVDQLTKVVTGSQEIETYSYDNYGNLSQKSVKSNDGQGNTVNHVYTYRYKNDLTGELKGLEIGTSNTVRYENDVNGRLKEKTICTGVDGTAAKAPALMSENYYYRKVGDHATNQISTIRYGARKGETLILRDSVRYAYDGMGNITKVYENGEQEVTYEYDGIGRLTRENNKILEKTYLITYDNNGNILSRKEYAYTLKKAEELPEEYDEYTYGYEKNTDKLLEICSCVKGENGNYVESTQTFTYDSIGNPTSYKGKSVTWTKGRQMTGYDGVTFGYNGQGQRISKTKAGTVKYLYDVNGNLVKESGKGVEYYYDGSGVIGMKYNERVYFYRKDIFGNITEIIDSNGEIVVRYRYDGWGNHVVLNPDGSKNESDTFIGNINPFRYRGYYYDVETGLYYLKTRYYDPEVGRFITIDDISYLAPDTINGLNLYAYCGNNPILYVDYNGNFPVPIWLIIMGFAKDIFMGTGVGLLEASAKLFAQLAKVPLYLLDDVGGAVFNPVFLQEMTKATKFQYAGTILNSVGKVAKVASYALLVVDVGFSIYNNFTNSNLSTSRKITDSVVDVGFSIGGFFASMAIGSAIGSLIPIPIIGSVIGAIAGALFSLGVYLFQQTNWYNDLKVGFHNLITQTIPNAWNQFVNGWDYFWSFSWI